MATNHINDQAPAPSNTMIVLIEVSCLGGLTYDRSNPRITDTSQARVLTAGLLTLSPYRGTSMAVPAMGSTSGGRLTLADLVSPTERSERRDLVVHGEK